MSLTDDEMLDVFVQESREHLESLEPDLLSLEDNPNDSETINRIFRSVHSLKGTSGFFGLNNISKLAHVMENLMSLARDGVIVLSPPMIEALLKGKDKLSLMVDDPQGSSEMDIQAEIALVEPFIGGDQHTAAPVAIKTAPAKTVVTAPPAPAQSVPSNDVSDLLKLFRLDPKEFKKALKNNHRVYVLKLHTQSDIKAKGRTPLDFFNEIGTLGEFLDSHTNLGPIQGLDNSLDADLIFMFLFAAAMEPDLVAGCFDIHSDQIIEIPRSDVEKVANAPAIIESQEYPLPPPPKKISLKKIGNPTPQPAIKPPLPVKPQPPVPVALGEAPKKLSLKPAALSGAVFAAEAEAELEKETSIPSSAGRKTMGAQLARKKAEETIRVPVSVLDDLMTLAGEMVLGRNQLLRLSGLTEGEIPGMSGVLQTINVVTSDLQEKVMQTRLQPISSILGKFNRIIRDLGAKLGKEIDLDIQGKDVELDRSILEAISDPLTHLIRNCADHAIEKPEDRERAGKPKRGLVKLIARHAGGQVHVEIIDDGKGLDPVMLRRKALEKGILTSEEIEKMSDRQAQAIIFLPGFSSAESISDVSGRGVGMDVVKTNIEGVGGNVELDSTVGKGTRVCLKLPLTLAIVPAMIIESSGHRFAVPQVNLEEVVSLDANNKIEKVRGSPVLRLRNKLLPLISLHDVLNIPDRINAEGQKIPCKDAYIMVLKSDQNQYGLIVEELLNIEEIVVKPLSRYLQNVKCYSGTTILGDGKVAVILDTSGITDLAALTFSESDKFQDKTALAKSGSMRVGEAQSLLIFRNSMSERFAINLAMVARIEKIRSKDIERVGSKEYIKYLGGSLRLLRLHDFMAIARPTEEPEFLYVIVPNLVASPLGIIATEVIDAIESAAQLDERGITGKGILGSSIIEDHLTIFVNVYSIFEEADPENYSHLKDEQSVLADKRILYAEDTSFFRTIVVQYLKDFCGSIDVAKHGQEAWEMIQKKPYDMLLTDIEMPFMDGFELTEKVRAMDSLKDLPIVALTSLSSERHIKRGEEVGVTAYETKLDKERLRETLEKVFGGGKKRLPGPQTSVIRAQPVAR